MTPDAKESNNATFLGEVMSSNVLPRFLLGASATTKQPPETKNEVISVGAVQSALVIRPRKVAEPDVSVINTALSVSEASSASSIMFATSSQSKFLLQETRVLWQ